MKLPIDCLIDTNGFVRLVEKHHFQDFTIAHKLLDMAANGHVNLYRAEITDKELDDYIISNIKRAPLISHEEKARKIQIINKARRLSNAIKPNQKIIEVKDKLLSNGLKDPTDAEIVATAAVKGMIFFSFDYTTIKHVEIWGGIEDTLSEFNLSLENIRNQKFLEDVVKQSKKH